MPFGPRPRSRRALRFVDEYLVDLNATAAAIRSGYKPTTAKDMGHELLGTPWVKEQVDAALAERAERTRLSQDEVVGNLRASYKGAMEAGDFKAANRAAELLGKALGMFGDKLAIDFRSVATLSDDELAAKRKALGLVH